MSTPTIPEVQPPKCPHCAAALQAVGLYNWDAPNGKILAVYCPGCQKMLHMEVLLILQQPAAEGSRISKPH